MCLPMTTNPHNKWLKKHIENILIPALQEAGFEWKKQGSVKEVGREIVWVGRGEA